jgi:S1-C subfamily serine protease
VVGVEPIVVVRLHDGRRLIGAVLWKDEAADLAAIAVRASGLSAMALRCDEPARLGEEVSVVGNPAGLDWSVTWGRISHTQRLVLGAAHLQVDATTFFGNSGGPLIDRAGRVVGILRAMPVGNTPWGVPATVGLAYAIPAERVCRLLAERGT